MFFSVGGLLNSSAAVRENQAGKLLREGLPIALRAIGSGS